LKNQQLEGQLSRLDTCCFGKAQKAGLYAKSVNGDVSDEIKQTLALIKPI
jgi:trans-2-enoyl-CoA reductase